MKFEKNMFWAGIFNTLSNEGWSNVVAVDAETRYFNNGDATQVVRPTRERIENGNLVNETMELHFKNGRLTSWA
jgi:hypothetical protein